ncbi:MAG: EutN/CcmL family microcompartment protein [Myxococcales bacterium]|nr:EutN/CcmL family microcompartment protein [Myxococcales bacterium]
MLLGKIIGTVVATRKEPELSGLRMMLVQELNSSFEAAGKIIVAVDAVGAGQGEVVLFASGSSARQTAITNNRPVDHVIMAVVDLVTTGGETRYDKSTDAG